MAAMLVQIAMNEGDITITVKAGSDYNPTVMTDLRHQAVESFREAWALLPDPEPEPAEGTDP